MNVSIRTRPRVGLGVAGALLAIVVGGCGGEGTSTRPSSSSADGSARRAADVRPFASTSEWNRRGDGLPVDTASARMLSEASERAAVVDVAGREPVAVRRPVTSGLAVNTRRWTTPIVSGGVPTRLRCRQARCGTGVSSLRVPAGTDPDPRYDGWMTVIQGDTAYDLWRARRERDTSISYQFLRTWDLRGPGAGRPGETSARGSGLPLFAGLIRRRELASGLIDHALAISLPGPAAQRYVRPASSTNGDGPATAVPEGARIRLRPGIRLRSVRVQGRSLTRAQQRARDAIVVALRQYGAIVVDRAAVPTLYAERGFDPEQLVGDELLELTLRDFEVTRLGRVAIDDRNAGSTTP